jgi:mannose-6-phosphate isomerase-like protein (cupin superfamily)
VHGFRNGSDADVRYLNLHAPGQGFASFMRALRDGRDFSYDQEPPPPDGVRPPTEAVIGAGGPLLADIEAIRVEEVSSAPGGPRLHTGHVASFYVLEGELALSAAGREIHAEAGSWLQVPAGVPHELSAPEPARFLDLRTPLA